MTYALFRPLLFALSPETAHDLSLRALARVPAGHPAMVNPALCSTVAGLRFPGPVGLAAGFDKDAQVADRMHHFGFGFAELGTLTPLPQPGNPRPRLFRLREDRAVINRMGFNNGGQDAAAARIAAMARADRVIGINIGANKDATDRIADYAHGVARMAPLADYMTINISSPNTPGLRALQDKGALDALLDAVMAARADTARQPPIFLKVAPDLDAGEVDDIARACIDHGVDALIVSNTTVARPPLRSVHGGEAGGLSGAPLHDLALAQLRTFRAATGARIPLIGAGGIASAEHAYARIRAGASLVQLYSALIYEGPWLARRINAGLVRLLARDGHANIMDAVGTEP